jgi:hypothetical protein
MQGMFTRLATERLNALALRFPAVIILGAQFWGQILLCASSEHSSGVRSCFVRHPSEKGLDFLSTMRAG